MGNPEGISSPNWYARVFRSFEAGESLSQRIRRFDVGVQLFFDAEILISSVLLAYIIRFEGKLEPRFVQQLLVALPCLVFIRLALMWRGGVYRCLPKYFALPDVVRLAKLHSIVTATLLGSRLLYAWKFESFIHLPLSVIALESLLSFGGLVTYRTLQRTNSKDRKRVGSERRKRVLLYGAGSAGVALWKQLLHDPKIEVVGFIDDDPAKVGRSVSGLTVLGDGDALNDVVTRYNVEELTIAIASCGRALLSKILSKCQGMQIPAKVVPSLGDIAQGSNLGNVRDVSTELILGRDGVCLRDVNEQVHACYTNKRILVTGAGGSIGSELVRQLLLCEPSAIAILDKDENSIYELEQELQWRPSSTLIECQIADIRIRERILPLIQRFKPDVVFHAAAHKHVPLMEKHPCEAILNNVEGTRVLLETCRAAGVDHFIFVSTDKAVNPTSIMGATKRIGEMLVQCYGSAGPEQQFTCVRFGNVVGSRGSFIPLFHRQIAKGGPITVTHPDMVRYFMSIPEAVQLVLHAGRLGKRGEVFVLELGTARKIMDVACEIARLSGLEPGRDIAIEITGLRPGEKLVEELVGYSEQVCSTSVEKLLMVTPAPLEKEQFVESIDRLIAFARANDAESIYHHLASMNIGFRKDHFLLPVLEIAASASSNHAA